jgi:hypothetical protein
MNQTLFLFQSLTAVLLFHLGTLAHGTLRFNSSPIYLSREVHDFEPIDELFSFSDSPLLVQLLE